MIKGTNQAAPLSDPSSVLDPDFLLFFSVYFTHLP